MTRKLGKILPRHEKETARKKRGSKQYDWLEHVDVVDFLESLDLDNIAQSKSDEWKFSCPFSGHSSGDSNPSAFMNTGTKDKSKTTVWICFGCSRSGNAINFYSEYANVSKTEAATHIRQHYAGSYRAPEGGIAAEFEKKHGEFVSRRHKPGQEPMPILDWDMYNERFGVNWEEAYDIYTDDDECKMSVAYLFDRGFLTSTLEEWSVGYDYLSDRLTIPACDHEGKLVGMKGRTWKQKEKPKYLVLGDKEGRRTRYGFSHYEKARIMFGLNHAMSMSQFDGTVVLVEGELDVIALWQIGIPAISTGSAHMSDDQHKIIRDYCDTAIVFFDSNTAGWNATFGFYNKDGEWRPGLVERLEPFIRVRVVDEHDDDASKMVEEGRDEELRDLISSATSSRLLV